MTGDVCCGNITLTGMGSVPNCTSDPIVVACEAANSCKTHLPTSFLSCPPGTETVRLCKVNSDCTEAGYMHCCTFGGGDAGGSLSFCANDIIGAGGGGTCQ
jgi:hypothetical protein